MRKLGMIVMAVCMSVSIIGAEKKPLRVACVGNSITYGYGLPDRDREAYPMRLQEMLGEGYEVGNFGKSGATLLYRGHRPYVKQEEFRRAMDFAADIVVIHLGINDTDPRDWPLYRDDFVPDYMALIDSFRAVRPDCRVLVARMTPIPNRHHRFETSTRDWHDDIQQAIVQVARNTGAQLIDFYKPLHAWPNLFPDALHPNAEGTERMARVVYQALTGRYGGLAMSPLYTDNMVLQHGCPLPLSGRADAGEKVTVEIAGQKRRAVADTDGRWNVTLTPLKAGGPYELKIATGKRTLHYANVLAGEVWMCSGQSNMEFMLKQADTGVRDIPQSTNNSIRLYDMKARWRTDNCQWPGDALDSINHLKYFRPTAWQTCTPAAAADFSAVAYYFGRMLQDSLHVPVGLICNAVGGSPAEAWIGRHTLEHEYPVILRNWMKNDLIQDWVRERANVNILKRKDNLQRHPYEPCYLFESAVQPLLPYRIKGVIWYQGESNAHNTDAHERLFPLLADSWRKAWGDDGLPFYVVQLSSIDRPSWPWFRDSQRRMADGMEDVYLAVSSDCGDSLDVHPRRKQPVGERLALQALYHTYRLTGHVPSGPVFRAAEFVKGEACLTFDYAEGLKGADDQPLCGFEIAGEDGLFHPAQVKVDGGRLRVSAAGVKHPVAVRYGWQPFTRANLVNGAGLPASTFRTDN
ncbi:MAG: GDSL-type esterase/lipase family protein [Clostridium sp.]|nr:GDSL-type esterase/lipase family protein [Clostridium sp.]